ncbi:unnamed protein product [Prorocentrum cordatum]|uniref:SH3 domain-containing protein n=1 Tax=Prorocentrum cordatum TaxID=2364126 RepID=A0ABN9QID6_9DINO|nr:unnamed protein product [Polarella glacialis]
MRAAGTLRLLVAAPVEAIAAEGPQALAIEPGDVVACEAADSEGWALASVVAPVRLAGRSGCFPCDRARVAIAELRRGPEGDRLEFSRGLWEELQRPRCATKQEQLRHRVLQNRLGAARAVLCRRATAASPESGAARAAAGRAVEEAAPHAASHRAAGGQARRKR